MDGRQRHRQGIAIGLCLALVLAAVANAATTYTWTQTTAGSYTWSTSGNWSGGAIPVSDSGSWIDIPMPVSGTLGISHDLASPFTLNRLRFFNNNNGTLNLSGGDLRFAADGATAPQIRCDVANTYNAHLNIANNLVLAGSDLTFSNTQGNNAPNNYVFTGAISGTGSLIKSGGGASGAPVALNGTKTFTGSVTGNGGTLYLGGANSWTGNLTVKNTATVFLKASINDYTGTTTVDAGGSLWLNPPAGGTWAKDVVNNGTFGCSDYNRAALTLAGLISGSGAFSTTEASGHNNPYQPLTISRTDNTFTGSSTIRGWVEVSKLADLGQPSSLGAPTTVADGTIRLLYSAGGTSFRYTGAGDTSNRVIDVNGSAAVYANGSGPIVFTSDLQTSGTSSKTLTLTGSNTGANTLRGTIPDYDGTRITSLVKDGAGTWALGGNNTAASYYTGTTTIGNGTLRATVGTGGSLGSGNLNLEAGTWGSPVFESSADIVRPGGTGPGQMQIKQVQYLGGSGAGFSVHGGNIKVCFGSLASPDALTWGVAPFQPYGTYDTRSWFVLNGSTADGTLDFRNPVDLNGATRTVNTLAATAIMSGALTGGAGSALNKGGAGTLWLTGTNSYPGATYIGAGVLRAVDGIGIPAGGGEVRLQGGVWESSADIVRPGGSGSGQMRLTGNANGGFSAAGAGTVNVAFGSLASPTAVTWTLAPFQVGVLTLNAPTATGTLDFRSSIDLYGAARTIRVDAGTAILSGQLIGWSSSYALVKTGNGTLKLTGSNNYPGSTTIQAGTLVADSNTALGNGAGTATVNSGGTLEIAAGRTIANPITLNGGTLAVNGVTRTGTLTLTSGTLSGTGTVNQAAALGAGITLAPGGSPGTLSFGSSLSFDSGSVLAIELGGTAPGAFDTVSVAGTADLAGTLQVSFYGSFLNPLPTDTFTVLTRGGGTGAFAGLPEGGFFQVLGSGYIGQISYAGGDGNDVVLFNLVPEPGAAALLALAAVAVLRRRRSPRSWTRAPRHSDGRTWTAVAERV